jgi:hypothetical protein
MAIVWVLLLAKMGRVPVLLLLLLLLLHLELRELLIFPLVDVPRVCA